MNKNNEKYWLQNEIDKLKDTPEYKYEYKTMEITEKICGEMEKRNWNKKDLAEKLGCSPAYITKLLSGDTNFTVRTLFQLSNVFDVKLEINFDDKTGNNTEHADSQAPEKIKSVKQKRKRQIKNPA